MMSVGRYVGSIMLLAGWMAHAQAPNPLAIVSISVCSPSGTGGQGSCPSGSTDTEKPVLAPTGGVVNSYGGLDTLADEHSTILPPGTLPGHSDYLFFEAARTNLSAFSSGLVVLTGGSGPNTHGQWTLAFASDFGSYSPNGAAGSTNGQIFVSPVEKPNCPTVGKVAQQDQTFDLNYADPGSVLVDPTNPSNSGTGSVLMIYEGTNVCIGLTGGSDSSNSFYAETGVATSLDYGHTWPAYRSDWVPLPSQNASVGPQAPQGAMGSSVCIGNDCATTAPANYGRYAVLGPPLTVAAALAVGQTIATPVGDSEPSAFIDDVSANPAQYVYEVHHYNAGPAFLQSPPLANGDPTVPGELMIARARLNGGTAPLSFTKWYQGSFSEPGLGPSGGLQSGILPLSSTGFANCESPQQVRGMPAISFVDATQQYLLTFMCKSPTDPLTQAAGPGAAWFYSTLDATLYDLSDQAQWTPPQEIVGSWSVLTACADGVIEDFNGNYPSFMSLGVKPGHLSTSGYVFFMEGCPGDPTIGTRQFSTRVFTMTTGPAPPAISLVANAEGESPTIAPNTWVEVKGANLAPAGVSSPDYAPGYCWQTSDFVNGKMPTQLHGVSVTVNGKNAYLYYISPTQVNILTPPDAMSGAVQVVVTNNGLVSASYTVQAQAAAPSFFAINGGPYVLAQHANYSLLGPASLSVPGYTFTPAKPGETMLLYANGFGAVSPAVVSGASSQTGTLNPLPTVTIGGIAATVQFAGINGPPGLFQLNVVVPFTLANGDQLIMATYNGLTTQAGTLITVQN
jgi:uncharacterized protein (TIGR03437 family)